MSKVGYYRYKLDDTVEGTTTVSIFISGALALTANVITKKFCDGFRLVKYLDKSGKYRVYPFNANWEQKNTPTQIGTTNKFVTSILSDQSNTKNIGYKNTRKLSLTAGNVSSDELAVLEDLYYSPRVYLYVGTGTNDNPKDWVLVTITGDGIGRMKKNNFKKVNIEITLPEHYSIRI